MSLNIEVLGVYDGLTLTPLRRDAELYDLPTKHYFADEAVDISVQSFSKELEVGDEAKYASGSLYTWNRFTDFWAYNGLNGLSLFVVASYENLSYTVQFKKQQSISVWGNASTYYNADMKYVAYTHSVYRGEFWLPVVRQFFSTVETAPYHYSADTTATMGALGTGVGGSWIVDTLNMFMF